MFPLRRLAPASCLCAMRRDASSRRSAARPRIGLRVQARGKRAACKPGGDGYGGEGGLALWHARLCRKRTRGHCTRNRQGGWHAALCTALPPPAEVGCHAAAPTARYSSGVGSEGDEAADERLRVDAPHQVGDGLLQRCDRRSQALHLGLQACLASLSARQACRGGRRRRT